MPDVQFHIEAAPVLVPLWLIGLGAWAAALRHRRMLTFSRLVTVVLTLSYAAAVLRLTVLPLYVAVGFYANAAPWYQKLNAIPLVTIDAPTFLLNVVMTVPVGLALPLLVRVRRLRQVALVGLGVSSAIELTQFVTDVLFSSARTADVNDLLANTLGAVLGWLVIGRLRRSAALRRLLDQLTMYAVPGPGLAPRSHPLVVPAPSAEDASTTNRRERGARHP